MSRLARVTVLVALIPVLLAWDGLAISVLWGWFVVPLGVPAIGVAHGAGIKIFATAFHLVPRKKDDREDSAVSVRFVASALVMAVALALGWAAHWAMVTL